MAKNETPSGKHHRQIEELAEWLQKYRGIKCPQTAWDLALDLEPLIERLEESCRDVVTKRQEIERHLPTVGKSPDSGNCQQVERFLWSCGCGTENHVAQVTCWQCNRLRREAQGEEPR